MDEHEAVNRALKATRLADAASEALRFTSAVLSLGVLDDDEVRDAAANLKADDWHAIARLIGLHPPSRATIASAQAILGLRAETKTEETTDE